MASTQQHVIVGNHEGFLILEVIDKRLTEEGQVSDWQQQMAEAIRRASPAGVVIDMQHVEYMTSVAIFPLIATRAVAEEIGAKLILCNLSEIVAKVLTVTQLIVESREHARHLAIAETREDALRNLKK